MSRRDVVIDCLCHRQPCRVPVDFGATAVTGMHVTCVAALREHFGLERRPVKVHKPYQMLGLIEPDLQDALGIDVTCPTPRNTMFGFSATRIGTHGAHPGSRRCWYPPPSAPPRLPMAAC